MLGKGGCDRMRVGLAGALDKLGGRHSCGHRFPLPWPHDPSPKRDTAHSGVPHPHLYGVYIRTQVLLSSRRAGTAQDPNPDPILQLHLYKQLRFNSAR